MFIIEAPHLICLLYLFSQGRNLQHYSREISALFMVDLDQRGNLEGKVKCWEGFYLSEFFQLQETETQLKQNGGRVNSWIWEFPGNSGTAGSKITNNVMGLSYSF